MDVDGLIDAEPKLHMDSSRRAVSWGLSREALRYIAEKVRQDLTTLETGAGVSTVLFALRSTKHVCITPNNEEVRRVTDYCKENGISTATMAFIVGRSEEVLPTLETTPLDLVLIDGRHAFPTPFIDWYYTSERLRVDGLMVIDDTQLWTGRILRKFLISEPEWRLDKDFSKTSCFVKVKEGSHLKEWPAQAFVKKRSSQPGLYTHFCSAWSRCKRLANREA